MGAYEGSELAEYHQRQNIRAMVVLMPTEFIKYDHTRHLACGADYIGSVHHDEICRILGDRARGEVRAIELGMEPTVTIPAPQCAAGHAMVPVVHHMQAHSSNFWCPACWEERKRTDPTCLDWLTDAEVA